MGGSPTTNLIAVSASFTAEALQPAIAFWLRELALPFEVRFAPYNQVFQQLLDPAGLLAANTAGVNVALVRFEDWAGDTPAQAQANAERLLDAARHSGVPILIVVCPATPSRASETAAAIEILRAGAATLPTAHLLTPAEIDELYPVAEIHDPHANELGRVPYTPLFFTALATAVVRKLHAIRSTPYKVIALDCDDTLWQGICGEDGPQGVTLDPPRRELQQFMRAQRDAGMLLAISSKNNQADVEDTFAAHPEFPLGWNDFTAHRIDWEPKGANLAEIAAELDLGLDTFILVDDNPKECTETQAAVPEVLTLPLPPDPAEIPAFLRHVWAFDHARITDEDRRRSALYTQQAERTRLARSSASLEEFLASLHLDISINPARPEQFRRIAQLTQRTNQMNASAVRRTETDIEQLAGEAHILAIDVSDRFGGYGLTGVVIYREQAPALVVDTFLLSCRVLGRGVEHRALARLGEIARERGLATIRIHFTPAPRNTPARLFLESVARHNGDSTYSLDSDSAAALRYRPDASARTASAAAVSAVHAAPISNTDYARIATHLRDPQTIHQFIYPAAPVAATHPVADPPRTPLEQSLADLWCELLQLPAIGIHDSFFELGGHSLLAVQLLSRVRQIWGVDLSLEIVYSGRFTVAELARAIELKEIEQAAGSDYQDLLQELEGLSDDEVRALLEQEQGDH